ncbi:MAG TPA: phosphate/phosphite/phosphonate ABC transporter substrate-binding protein [Gammaproteobacteria bacterium]|nr:phosphate/phosphite/phosphonate ABC transporter substrate-binding protein [Gammaproteobacteria bacterium]
MNTISDHLYRWCIWAVLLLGFDMLVACSQDDNSRTVKILKIAVLPDQSESQLHSKYQPLQDYIKSRTGLNSTLLIPASYKELLQWFDDKHIDMALFGGVTYVKAHLQSNAIPLVIRDVDGRFRSIAIVSANNPASSLQDIKGASLAFGSRLSTSGHLMPRYFLRQNNIIPEEFFSKILYSGAHDVTAEWVRDGKVEAGLTHSGIANEMFLDGRLGKDKVKVIWKSPPFADYVWAVQQDISKQQRTMIRDTFLYMNQNDEGKLLLQSLGANYYIPAGNDDFSKLEQIILQMEQHGHKQ